LWIGTQAAGAAPAQGVMQQEIQAVRGRQKPALNLAMRRGREQMREPVMYCGFGQRGGNVRQVSRLPRDDADIRIVTLVARTGERQINQRLR